MKQSLFTIKENIALTSSVYKMTLEGDVSCLNSKEIVNNVTHVPNSVLSFHYDVYEYLKIPISKCIEQLLFALQGVSQHHFL